VHRVRLRLRVQSQLHATMELFVNFTLFVKQCIPASIKYHIRLSYRQKPLVILINTATYSVVLVVTVTASTKQIEIIQM